MYFRDKITTSNLINIFKQKGVTIDKNTVDKLMNTVCDLYEADDIPWVLGYSGGKDSTAMLLRMLEENMPIDKIIFVDNLESNAKLPSNFPLKIFVITPFPKVILISFPYQRANFVLSIILL